MSFPETKEFENALSAVEITSERPDGPHDVYFDPRNEFSDKGVPVVSEQNLPTSEILYLKYPDDGLSKEALVLRIQREMKNAGCESNSTIALFVLGLIADSRPYGQSAVEHANSVIANHTVAAQVHHYKILPVMLNDADAGRFSFGNVRYELFDPNNILYWINKGQLKSAYPIDIRQLRGRICFRRQPRAASIIDFTWFERGSRISKREMLLKNAFIDQYYNEVFRCLVPLLQQDVLDCFQLLEAVAIVYFDDKIFHSFPDALDLGFFMWDRKTTWAVCHVRGPAPVEKIVAPKALQPQIDRLEKDYGFKKMIKESGFGHSIQVYVRLLQRAQRHWHQERSDEAFLHFMIGLDMLFGVDGSNVESVTKRVAVLVHRQIGESFDNQVKVLKKLYTKRSAYVHRGAGISQLDGLIVIEEICVQVLWCLLTARKSGRIVDLSDYLKKIDHLVSALLAEFPIGEEQYQILGISGVGENREIQREKRYPPR